MVDKTAQEANGVNEVTMPDGLGAELLLKVAATIDWYHGKNPHTGGEPTDKDIADFGKNWLRYKKAATVVK